MGSNENCRCGSGKTYSKCCGAGSMADERFSEQISFYITGPQKSGTTLLVSLLNQHPGLFCLVDTLIYNEFFRWLIYDLFLESKFFSTEHASVYFKSDNLRADALDIIPTFSEVKWFVSKLLNRYYTKTMGLLAQSLENSEKDKKKIYSEYSIPYQYGRQIDPVPILEMGRQKKTWSNIIEAILLQLVPEKEKKAGKIIGEKTPGHISLLYYIRSKKNIIIVRNPIANIASYYKREYAGAGDVVSKNDLSTCMDIYDRYNLKALLNPENEENGFIYFVRFEDLLQDCQRTCNGIFNYLDLPEANVQPEFMTGVKGDYVGNKIDHERAEKNLCCFSKDQEQKIIERNRSIFEKFYSKELV